MQILRRRAAPLIPDDPLNPSFKRVNYEEQEAAEEAALRAAASGELPPPPPPLPLQLLPPDEQPEASQSEPSDSRSKRKRRARGKGGAKAAPKADTAAAAAHPQADSATTASDAASAQQRLTRAVQQLGSVPLAEMATQPLDTAQLAEPPPLPAAAEREPAQTQVASAPQQAGAKVLLPLVLCCCLPVLWRLRHLASLPRLVLAGSFHA